MGTSLIDGVKLWRQGANEKGAWPGRGHMLSIKQGMYNP